ncbi:MAG: hypothetical protein KatS3mg109_1845 [Pirellulaceae bacterium]|nr:MAG: hypothetical protein KatS3mg109_1845 [Pirellulaceae bacterium]GIW95413.1 MAG: hypothetical protein KatS3mg110_3454 [Pirellulaceae bacterium]
MKRMIGIVSLFLAATLGVQAASAEDAAAVLRKAHEARSTWNGFPGFRADVVVVDGQTQANGWVEVDRHGAIRFEVPNAPAWFEGKLRSFVEHRFGDAAREYQASFETEPQPHPLGRLIRIDNDTLMGSRYRVDGDVVREVHRHPADGHFTITVLDVQRNPLGKYVPRVYTVSYWDSQGQLVAVTVERDDWLHKDGWDLPLGWVTIRTANGSQRQVRSVTFSNHSWLSAATAGSSSP